MKANGTYMRANNILTEVDCDAGNLGWDGAGTPAEFRPTADVCPVRVVQNLFTLFQELKDQYILPIFAGNGLPDVPCGGHIHIGISGSDEVYPGSSGTAQRDLTGLLDTMLLPFSVALCLPVNFRRELRDYGGLGDERGKSYGFEYRTQPSWMRDPKTALFFLRSAKAITMAYLDENLDIEELIELGGISPGTYSHKDTAAVKRGMTKLVGKMSEALTSLPYMRSEAGTESLNHIRELIERGSVWDQVDIQGFWDELDIPKEDPPPLPKLRVMNSAMWIEADFSDGEYHVIREPLE